MPPPGRVDQPGGPLQFGVVQRSPSTTDRCERSARDGSRVARGPGPRCLRHAAFRSHRCVEALHPSTPGGSRFPRRPPPTHGTVPGPRSVGGAVARLPIVPPNAWAHPTVSLVLLRAVARNCAARGPGHEHCSQVSFPSIRLHLALQCAPATNLRAIAAHRASAAQRFAQHTVRAPVSRTCCRSRSSAGSCRGARDDRVGLTLAQPPQQRKALPRVSRRASCAQGAWRVRRFCPPGTQADRNGQDRPAPFPPPGAAIHQETKGNGHNPHPARQEGLPSRLRRAMLRTPLLGHSL